MDYPFFDSDLNLIDERLLPVLLADRTTGRSIVW